VFAKGGVKESVRSGILIGVAEGEFVADGSFFRRAKVWPIPML